MEKEVQMENFLFLIDKLVASNEEIMKTIDCKIAVSQGDEIATRKAESLRQAIMDIHLLTRLAQELQGHVEILQKRLTKL